MMTYFRPGFTLLFLLNTVIAFDRPFCEFRAPDYQLEWAYEPSSKTVVFVLKVNSTAPRYWTGVGFEGRKGPIDFVGVLVRDKHVVLADAYLNSSGVLYTDVLGNVQTIGYDYDGTQLVAKFARPILSDDVKNDQQLDECTTFTMPHRVGEILPEGIRPDVARFNRLQVCGIQEHCAITLPPRPAKLQATPEDKDEPRIAKSVDVSGTGDPCAFTGHDYSVNWTYTKSDDAIHFLFRIPMKKGKLWSAIGIGDNMSDMDIGLLFLDDGEVKKMGDFFSSAYGPPEEDASQDWRLDSAKLVDADVEIRFSRAVVTADSEKDRSMEDCVLFQFGSNSGKWAGDFKIRKHEGWPDLYKACNLRDKCLVEETPASKRPKSSKKPKNTRGEEVLQTRTPEFDENNDDNDTTTSEQSAPKDKKKGRQNRNKGRKNKNNNNKKDETVEGSGEDLEASGQEPEATTEALIPTTEAVEPTTEITEAPEAGSSTAEPTTAVATEAPTTVEAAASTTTTEEPAASTTPAETDSCDPKRADLAVCQGYMDSYLNQVRDWARRHGETMEQQYGKACSLLSAVPHVPTLCCHVFQKVCSEQISH